LLGGTSVVGAPRQANPGDALAEAAGAVEAADDALADSAAAPVGEALAPAAVPAGLADEAQPASEPATRRRVTGARRAGFVIAIDLGTAAIVSVRR